MSAPGSPAGNGRPRRLRAVIIGAGPNGLVCAARLARAGADVTVLEQARGGYGGLATVSGPLPGFTHDICAAFFPLTRASPGFRSLPLDAIEWIDPPTAMAHPFLDGSAIALERDIGATAQSLGRRAGAAYSHFMSRLLAHHRALIDTGLAPFPAVAPLLRLVAGLRLDAARLGVCALLPAGDLGRHWLGDDRSAAWLAGSTAHSDLDPSNAGGGAFALVLHLLGHAVGWPFPRGGGQAVGEALAAHCESLGASIRHGAAVEQILGTGGRATGVRLGGGERLEADAVIATTTIKPFLDMLRPASLPRGVQRRLRRWRYDAGSFKVDFALDGPVPWTAEECTRSGVVHLGDTLPAFTSSFRAAREGRFPDEPALVLGQHSLFDRTRAPEGRHTLYCYARSPLRLSVDADEAADTVERRIEQFAPGFRGRVLGRAVRRPSDIEAHDPAMVGGDLGGGSYTLDQQLFLRPHPRMFRTRTPIRGLYLAGASVHPGGGVHGSQGLTAAMAVLDDLG